MTANDIISSALRKLGVLYSGEAFTAEQQTSGLEALNDMLEAWSIDRLNIFTVSSEQYQLQGGKQSYTIGIDPAALQIADFPAARPNRIERASVILTNNPAQPLRQPLHIMDDAERASITLDQVGSSIPQKLYCDGGYPLATIYLYPLPSDSNAQLELWTWSALQQFANGSTRYYFPPGYGRALKNNLALELAAEYDREPSASLVRLAIESKMAIELLNAPTPQMRPDSAVFGDLIKSSWNWLTGNF
jgi:hypothetical protein